jgi:hypothetical protein
MAEDPVVQETRGLRAQMMEEAGETLEGLFELLKRDQEQYRERLVRLPSREVIPLGAGSGDGGRTAG